MFNTLSDSDKNKIIEYYNYAYCCKNDQLIYAFNDIFGPDLKTYIKKKYKFVPGDIVKYKSDLLVEMDQTCRFVVQYMDDELNELVRVENIDNHFRKTININNLELVKSNE